MDFLNAGRDFLDGGSLLLESVRGYTLAGDQIRRFDAMVVSDGKVVATGDAASLRSAMKRRASPVA